LLPRIQETVHVSTLSPNGVLKAEVFTVDEGATGGWTTNVRAGYSANFNQARTLILQIQELRPIHLTWTSPEDLVLEVLAGEGEAPEANWQMTVFESVRIETRIVSEWSTEKSLDLRSQDGMHIASYNIVSSVRPETEKWEAATFVTLTRSKERSSMPVLVLRGRIEPEFTWLASDKLEVKVPEVSRDDYLMNWPCYGPGCEVQIVYLIESR
jgi:hypothetical protein